MLIFDRKRSFETNFQSIVDNAGFYSNTAEDGLILEIH